MKIGLNSVLVDDQAKALAFYADVLGFVKKFDIDMGEARWLTVVSPDAPDGCELLLEPNMHPAAKVFQAAIYKDGIAATAFEVDDIKAEYARLTAAGVVFKAEPAETGGTWIAMFDDSCGSYIQLYQKPA
ncbi:MAG: VOC family protein [Dehalococcoidia bacterium]|jgi:predicted enzyme related to lactoylglutathione lyase|nr:VOC family protein [Dehalococcoidia bacterium]